MKATKPLTNVKVDETRSLVLVTQNHDSLRVFSPLRSRAGRTVAVAPLDAYALITEASGRTRREELYYGSTYLSQSSRYLRVPAGATKVVVFDSRGRSHEVATSPPPRVANGK